MEQRIEGGTHGRGSSLTPHDERDRRERRLFITVLVIGSAALFFGGLEILNSIRSPFAPTNPPENSSLGPTGATIATLSQKDTDGDGLSDFDELYGYKTSPYLADSDSDGLDDQAEISGGTNPNCQQGDTCSPLERISTANTNGFVNASNAPTNTEIPGTLSISDLRIALRNAGAPATSLENLDDAALFELYRDVLGESPSTTNTNAPTETNQTTLPETVDLESLENLSPEQMREFLGRGGADAATLAEVDDETLRLIFTEALKNLREGTTESSP